MGEGEDVCGGGGRRVWEVRVWGGTCVGCGVVVGTCVEGGGGTCVGEGETYVGGGGGGRDGWG